MIRISPRSEKCVAVPINIIPIRGPLSPWQLLADGLSARLGRPLTIGEIGLCAPDYGRLMQEERLFTLRGFDGPHARSTLARGAPVGYALVPAVTQ